MTRHARADIAERVELDELVIGRDPCTPRSLGAGHWAWLPRQARYRPPDSDVVVTLEVDLDDDGQPALRRLRFDVEGGGIFRLHGLSLPLVLIAEHVLRSTIITQGPDAPRGALPEGQHWGQLTDLDAAQAAAVAVTAPRRRRAATHEVLARVAAVYRDPPEGVSRRRAVADLEGVGLSRASRLIQLARQAGHLRAAPGLRQAGEIPET